MRIMVVDDSALMRKHLCSVLDGHELQTARNGREALEMLEMFCPDVITLDINMPEMDGLTTLSMIMLQRPTPVVMVSSLTERGALATFEALNLGAIDFVTKPGGSISLNMQQLQDELRAKVEAAASARLHRRLPAAPAVNGDGAVQRRAGHSRVTSRPEEHTSPAASLPLVLVGVSTGGPRTLETILPELPAGFPGAVIVAQHMPANFTGPLAARIDRLCALPVTEIAGPTRLEPGTVVIARGGTDIVVSRRGQSLYAIPSPASQRYAWHPSVERLVTSAMQACRPEQLTCVMLTGMGNDGAEAMAQVRESGGRTIAECESTAVVFGMPADLIKRGGASVVLPAPEIADQLSRWLAKG